jgi:ABC-type transport system substrate-binding protein
LGSNGEAEIAQLLFPALVRLDAHLQVVPWAAARYAVSADGRTYTFTLRPGMQWSDGTPLQAGDFAYALNRVLDPCTASGTAYILLPIRDAQRFNAEACTNSKPAGALQSLIGDSLLAPNSLTMVIKLEQPAAYILDALATTVAYAVPRALVQRYGASWTSHLTDGGGFGGDLFKLTTVKVQTGFVLTRNERFWGTKPQLREIDYIFPTGPGTAYRDYVAGTRDTTGVSPDDLASARLRGGELRSTGTLGVTYFTLNWATAPFDDERMRQAFALALDKGKLVTDAFGSTSIPTNHIVPEGMPGHNPDLTGPNSSGLDGNLQRAQALAQAYADDKCQGSLSNCPPVTVGVPEFPNAVTLATEAQQMW